MASRIDWYDQRQSGRTTRMLQAADYAKRQGERVAIFVHAANMIDYCGRLVRDHRLTLERQDFHTAQGSRAGWVLRGVDAQIYLDHHLIDLMDQDYSKVNHYADFYDNIIRMPDKLNVTSGGHVHDFKYVSADEDDMELWECSCGEKEYRDDE